MNTPQPPSHSANGASSQGRDAAKSHRAYQQQDCTLTLAEGLQEYYSFMPGLLPTETMRREAQALFVPHDVAHVVFGCDTSIEQEAMVDLWTMFGSDVGVRTYLDYLRVPEAKQIFVDTGIITTARASLHALPNLVRVIARTRRMHKKWSWKHHEAYMQRPLHEIRAEFGIRVLERSTSTP